MCLLVTQCSIFLSLKVPVGPGEDCTDAMHLRSMHLGHCILLSLSLWVHSLQALSSYEGILNTSRGEKGDS